MGAILHSRSRTQKRPRSLPLRFELLEDRTLLSGFATWDHVFYHPSGGGGVATPFGNPSPTGLTPRQIRHAYGFDQLSLDGTGTTIAIVDAYDDPNIASDLQAFDAQFGLTNPVFTKVNQTGGSTLPAANGGWASEIALDVQWAHVIAQGAKILLVEANDNSFTNLFAAVSFAASQPGVVAVSMSWGGGEFGSEASFDSTFRTPSGHSGVTFVASSGDAGAPPSYPAISPNVLAVGGTTLNVDSAGNYISESGWTGSGGGFSIVEGQPAFQKGAITAGFRSNPDVAYDADPNTGFPVYDSYNNGTLAPWSQIGGTSAASPQWAALIALADQGRILSGFKALDGPTLTLPILYTLPAADFHDITAGGSLGNPAYNAGPGYDLVTGRGTPLANKIVPDLSSPSSGDLQITEMDPLSGTNYLREYHPSGALFNSIVVPPTPATTDYQQARGLTIDPSGKIDIYNGTFLPYLSTYSPATQTWTNQNFPGWSTVNNGSYGGVAAFQNFVFATDMSTYGDSLQPLKGIVRFDSSGGPTTRFANTHEFIDLTMGLDGLLYGLTNDGPNQVYVYDPQTLALVRNFTLSNPLVSDTRSIAVDALGNILAIGYAGPLVKFDPSATRVLASTTLNGPFPPGDNLINMALDSDGHVAVGDRFGDVFYTDESLATVTSFSTNLSDVFVTFNHYMAPVLTSPRFWTTYAGNAQHTALSTTASQSLDVIHWTTAVNLSPPPPPTSDILIHYGTPLITPSNTLIVPVMTATGGFQVDGINAYNGVTKWILSTDYILPPHNWTPSYSASLVAPNAVDPNLRLYFAGAGGTIYYIDNPDSNTPGPIGRVAFYGLANYNANPAAYNSTVYVDTPITADSQGDIFFGFRVTGANPSGLASGIARIDANGNGIWASALAISGNDSNISRVPHQAAPALSNDQSTLYVSVGSGTSGYGYLVALNAATLVTKTNGLGGAERVRLKDPRNNNANDAPILDDSSASPMVGPDGDVYYGVFGNPYNGSRGWMLHFSGDLSTEKIPGAFGWDDTASIVPASMVPSYTGTSSYLLFTKYNNYAGITDGGDGVNKIAILDPNATEVEPHASSNGLLVMKEVMTIAGPTPDPSFINSGFPNAVREWCINSGVVDPFTKSVLVNSEDGNLYRWDLTTNTLSQKIVESAGIGEAYTPTVIGVDGTVYAINYSILNAVGRAPAMSINSVSAAEGNSGTTSFTFTVSLDYSSTQTITVQYATADGTATTADGDYQAASGTLTFAPGVTRQIITVLVNGNTAYENNETFTVSLSGATNATIATATGTGTILNDDPAPRFSINNVTMTIGASGTTNFVFTVTLTGATELPATVKYSTSDGTATLAENDYTATSGTLTFNPGGPSQTITVAVNGNPMFETDETFFVNLTNPVNAVVATPAGIGTIHCSLLAPPHIDSLTFLGLPLGRLLLRANNVTDPDDAVVSVSFYFESNGTPGLQTGTGGDLLLFTDTNPNAPWTATVLYRQGTYYAQALDASGLLSNVVQVVVGPKPIPLPSPDLSPINASASTASAPASSSSIGDTPSTSGDSGLWTGGNSVPTWLPAISTIPEPGFTMAEILANRSGSPGTSVWEVLNPMERLFVN